MKYHAQSCIPLAEGATFVRPPTLPRVVHLDDAALEVMTDFNLVMPVVVRPETSIDDALELMKLSGVRLLLVINADEEVIGLVTSYDIQGAKPIELANRDRIAHSEIRVETIMTPRSEIGALELGDVQRLKVGHIVETLQELERQHLLVVSSDAVTGRQKVCGLFSMTQIRRQLAGHASQIRPHMHLPTVAELATQRPGG
ncbi:MAG: CBS domain-containing protein [Candidatus Competibacterales bacterium]|nr:CBS domain-containing protein [Candidatus Competibacterales bacterium]